VIGGDGGGERRGGQKKNKIENRKQ